MILDCRKIEAIMISGNFHSLIELFIFGTAVVDVDSIDLFRPMSRLTIFGYPKMLNMITLSTLPVPEIDLSTN